MRDKHSVALILTYYGTFPNYFPLWLKSAGCNKNFDFFVFTDIDCSCYKIPENVHVVKMTLAEIRERANKHLDFECVLNTPYELCDYKPLYGLIFQDYLQNYEFWGHVDSDVIWGDMSKFLTHYIFEKFDRIQRNGYLLIYRNTDKINHFVLNKLPNWNISYRDIYKTRVNIGLDENFTSGYLNDNLFSNFAGGRVYHQHNFANAHPCKKEFRDGENLFSAFRWKDGKLFGLAINGYSQEYLFLHIQKRAMKFTHGLENEDSFLVVPNEFMRDHELSEEEITAFTTPDREYEKIKGAKYPAFTGKYKIKYRLRDFIQGDNMYRIIFLKRVINKLLRRRLASPYL